MTTDVPAPRTRAAIQARRHATDAKLQQVQQALKQMRRDHLPISYPAVARRAGVSRTFLYQNLGAKEMVKAAIDQTTSRRQQRQVEHDAHVEASWRERALNAEQALKDSYAEIDTQRDRIGKLLGQVRDLEGHDDEDTVQRIATENTTLKQRVRQLTQDTRMLEEKLQAARSNNRFLDKRIADLEAALLEATTNP